MKRRVVKKNGRDKAFIGAIIGAVAGIAGGIISGKKKKKAEEEAYAQAQDDQTRMEGVQQAAAMSSSYANQDYIDQYQNKITLKGGGKVNIKKGNSKDRIVSAKRYAMGGRKKYAMGAMTPVSPKIDSTGVLINNIGQGITNGISVANGNSANNMGALTPSTITGIDSILTNRKIAADANTLKTQTNNLNISPTSTRRTAAFGTEAGAASGGVGGLVGSLFGNSKTPKAVKKTDGFSFEAPKTGLIQNSYQLDANGNPITALNTPMIPVDPNLAINPAYSDRLQMAKMGKRKSISKRSQSSGL